MNATIEKAIDPREELAAAIAEHDAAEIEVAKAQAAIDRASLRLNAAEEAHTAATEALETAREAQAARLVEAASSDKAAPSSDGLRKARQAKESADDDVAAARTALDIVRDGARMPTYNLSGARRRREKAVSAVTRGQVERLIDEAQAQVERLAAKRAELIFVSRYLVDPYDDNATRQPSGILFESRASLP